MGEHDEQARYEYEKYHHDLTQAEAQLHDAGLTTGDMTEAQVFAVANALGRTAASARRAALLEAESAVAGCMNGYLGTPEFEGGKGLAIRNATTAIRALITGAGEGETR